MPAVLLCLCWLTMGNARAQEQLNALERIEVTTPALVPTKGRPLGTLGTDSLPLPLPFFDDFSGAYYRDNTGPDTTRWQSGSGVFVNNRFGINPLSRGVATFDGLNANGLPYFGTNDPVQQLTDSLVSRALALSDFSDPGAAGTVFLSFAWQALGPPVPLTPGASEDSLVLQFRTSDTTWASVWRVSAQRLTPFRNAIVQVPPALLTDAFQFRFLCYGRPSGSFDVWNIDYVFLDAFRDAGDTLFAGREEFAVSTGPTSPLGRYTAVPAEQFRAAPDRLTADSVFITANLLGTPRPLAFDVRVTEDPEGVTRQNLRVSNLGTPSSFQQQIRLGVPVDDALLRTVAGDSSAVTYTFALDAGNLSDPVRLANDTVSATFVLGDYYAHDDGSAELVYSLSPGLSFFAQAFYAPVRDTLTGVRMYFPQSKRSTEGLSFRLAFWSSLDDSVRLVQNASVRYPGALNAYAEYLLDSALIVQDTFYVGFIQQGSRTVKLGFDINTPPAGGAFFNVDG
ncbi:MAG: hypothetical protein WBA12_09670, partial [Catalinimonas sp.]